MGTARVPYDAFISYSHAATSRLAPALQSALQRFAKPWYRMRALNLYRDKTSLAATPSLWPSIEKALASCRWFLLLASPEAAASEWVRREVEWWIARGGAERLLILVAAGELVWDRARGDFDWERTTALPPQLKGVFKDEPLWVDLRWTAGAGDLTLRHSQFHACVVDIAAALYGRPKDEIDGEDVRQHRLTVRLAAVGTVALVVLAVTAAITAYQAIQQRDLARSRELAALSAASRATDPELSVVLALRAGEVVPTRQAEESLRAALPLSHASRTLRGGLYFNALSFSGDGKRIATASGWAWLVGKGLDLNAQVWDAETGKVLATLSGHEGPVRSATFSPDGRLVLTRADEPVARLWEADTGKPFLELRSGEGALAAASFSPDGRHVVTAGKDRVARVWALTPGAPAIELNHADTVNDAAYSPDGRTIATAAGDWRLLDTLAGGRLSGKEARFTAILWDAATGRERLRLPAFEAPVTLVRFAPDGKRLLTVSGDRSTRVWDAASGQLAAELRGAGWVLGTAFSADGRWIATASADATARVWDAASGALRAELRGHKQPLRAVAFNPDGSIVATSGGDPYAVVWDVASARPLGELRGHDREITSIRFSPDGRLIGTTSHDGTVRLWRVPAGAVVDPMGPVGRVERMALSGDGERILVENGEREASVWQRRTGTRLATFGPAATFTRPAWSADGNRVLVPVETDRAIVYDARTGAAIRELHAEGAEFRPAALSADGARVAAVRGSQALWIWDVASGQAVLRVPLDISVDEAGLGFSADGSRLLMVQFATGGSQLRDVATGDLIATLPDRNVRFSRSGRRILAIAETGPVAHVHDAATGKVVSTLALKGSSSRLADAEFVADDRQVLTVDRDDRAALWDVEGSRVVAEFALSMPLLSRLALSPDGRIAAVTGESRVAIWDLRAKKKVVDLRGHVENVAAARFTPDGMALVTAGADSTVRVFPVESFLPLDELVARARAAVSRKLSETEERYLLE